MNFDTLKKIYYNKNLDYVRKIEKLPEKKYTIAIIIPALKEFDNVKKLLSSISKNDINLLDQTAIIFVINNARNSSADIKEDNKKLAEYLNSLVFKNLNIGYIDAFSEDNCFSDEIAGVGLARKIGTDSAIHSLKFKEIEKKIIIFLDADCLVSENYLNEIYNYFTSKENYFAVIGYAHQFDGDNEINAAIAHYEIYLRYYALGLKYANSPYSFHTIGSTIAFLAEGYLKIGGMNKKKAGEDFYFLEKARKTFDIGYISTTTVFPSARKSFRVPFGTGKAINDILSGKKNYRQILAFENFIVLKNWNEFFLQTKINDPSYILKEAQKINEHLRNFLVLNKFEEDFRKIFKTPFSDKNIYQKKIEWFDALKTLKLLHYLRDNDKKNENWETALTKLLKAFSIDYDCRDLFESLIFLRNIYNNII